jgi:hypothetical protein
MILAQVEKFIMFDFSFDAATVKAVVTLLILAAAMYGFVSERLVITSRIAVAYARSSERRFATAC